jgi:hypothetical protein
MKISAPVVGGAVGETLISLLVLLLGGDPSGLWQQDSLPSDSPIAESPQTTGSKGSLV